MCPPLKPTLIRSLLKVLLAVHNELRATIEEDRVCERDDAILCGDQVDRDLFQVAEPTCEEFGFIDGRRQEN